MKILVRQIGPEGSDFQESFAVEFIEMAQADVLHFLLPFDTKAKVVRVRDEIIATVTVASRYASFCSRCLEEIEQDWSTRFALTFNAKEYPEAIEADEDIRQELILNLPVRILCREDCKGLCIDCGANLNKQTCQHQHAVPNS